MEPDAFDIQEIKRVRAVSLCFDIYYSLILAIDIVIYLSFVTFEKGRSYSQSQ